MTEYSFTLHALREAAEAKAGFNDYGSDSYLHGLETLLYSIKNEGQLNDTGEREMWIRIVNALANRLTVVAWEKANPEQANMPVIAPLVIIGLPRTGSSILHETLSAAPGARTPLIWEVSDYSLAHAVTDARSDLRLKDIEAAIARKNAAVPGYRAMHYEDPFIPMECIALTMLDVFSIQFPTMLRTYCRHLLSHDAAVGAYNWHRRALRYLQAGKSGTRWVLKAPLHSAHLDVLLQTYPDAMIVQTHRDPQQVIGSLCSLFAALRGAWSDASDTQDQAEFDAQFTADIIGRAVDFRDEHPEMEARIHDVAFTHFMSEPATALAGIYKYFGIEFDGETQDATVGYIAKRPREKYGKHRYSLEQFGLTAEKLDYMYKKYTDRFSGYI